MEGHESSVVVDCTVVAVQKASLQGSAQVRRRKIKLYSRNNAISEGLIAR